MNQDLVHAIESMRGLTVAALQNKYREVIGQEPRVLHQQYLFRRIAWQLQANAHGGLSDRAQRRVVDIADESDLHPTERRHVRDASNSTARIRHDPRLPPAGTLLTRRVQGRDIVVRVLEEGFEHDSRQYRSLSAIAREVTGTRWNGLLFFGLTGRK